MPGLRAVSAAGVESLVEAGDDRSHTSCSSRGYVTMPPSFFIIMRFCVPVSGLRAGALLFLFSAELVCVTSCTCRILLVNASKCQH